MAKKFLSILLVIAMLLTIAPVAVFAQDDVLSYLTYEIKDGKVTITNCDNSISGDVVIPDTIEGFPVTEIGDNAFEYCLNIKRITIPNSLTSIGSHAFYRCTSLESISLPDSLTNIGHGTFVGCRSLTNITIPKNVYDISMGYLFYGCTSLESITVDENNKSYTNDEYGALYNKDKTKLIKYPGGNSSTSYVISDSVTSIDDYAFRDCTSLESITVDENNQYYSSDEYGVLFNKDKTELIQYPEGNSSTSYTIPDSVPELNNFAFENCTKLESVSIPDSVTSIGWWSFYGCTSLESITVDEKNQYYSSDEDGVLFNKDKTELIKYPGGNSRTSYTIPDSVTIIGDWAFELSLILTEITVPDTVTDLGEGTFARCLNLEKIELSDNIDRIEYDVFNSCVRLKSIEIPENVTLFYAQCFSGCVSLEKIIFKCNQIETEDFRFLSDCISLKDVYFMSPDVSIVDLGYTSLNPDFTRDQIIESFESDHPVLLNSSESIKIDGMNIHGYKDSTAEAYATEHGFNFIDLETEDVEDEPVTDTPATDEPVTEDNASDETTENVGATEDSLTFFERIIEFFKNIFETIKQFFASFM